MATLTAGTTAINTDGIQITRLASGAVTAADAGHVQLSYSDGSLDDLYGAFTFSSTGALSGGTLTRFVESKAGALVFDLSGLAMPVTSLTAFVNSGDNAGALTLALSGSDTLKGSVGNDLIRGYAGDDVFIASGGSDTFDGGAGANAARFSGLYSNYAIASTGTGAWSVRDTRAGAPDGVATLTTTQQLQFADGALTSTTLPSIATANTFENAYANLARVTATSATASAATVTLANGSVVANGLYTVRQTVLDLAAAVDAGRSTQAAAMRTLEHGFDSTTSVATLTYAFFTGKTPTSAGYDYLVASAANPSDLSDPYYAQFSSENRYINFAVNLGKVGEGQVAFTAAYGSLTLADATKKAYLEVFGFAADDAKVSAILNAPVSLPGIATRADYFAYYGGDGAAGIGTKAAMVGYLLVEAVKADLGTYAQANDLFLDALAGGTATYNVNLTGTYHAAPQVDAGLL